MRRLPTIEALALRQTSAGDFSFRGEKTGMRCTAVLQWDGPMFVLARWWTGSKIIFS